MIKRYYIGLDSGTGGTPPSGLNVTVAMSPSSPTSNGTLTATVTGGTPPYTYNFAMTTTYGGGGSGHLSPISTTTSSTTAVSYFVVASGTGATYSCSCSVTDHSGTFVNSNVVYDGPM